VNKIFLALPVQKLNSPPLRAGFGIHGAKLIAVAAGLFLAFSANPGTAQNTQLPPRSRGAQNAKARPVSSQAPVLPATETPPPDILMPSRPSAEQLPLSPPQISYADGQLTITAENSTLTAIMTAIRLQMGADVELPPSASREHLVVRLGPGPAREVIAALLSWTDYDYVIQASDSDPAGIRSVLVTSRPKTGTGLASANSQMAQRFPHGRGGEVMPAPAEATADDPVPLAPDTPAATEAGQQVPQPATQAEAADQQTVVAETQPVAATTARKSDLANTMTAADTAALEAQAAALAQQTEPPAQDSGSNEPQSKAQEMIQQLQRMYQQRIQIQKTPPPSN
jgi:hypothetical protein